jgi:hypothetical protein
VASALEGGSRLLVFDNCEHVVDSVAYLVEAILAVSATGNLCRRRSIVAGRKARSGLEIDDIRDSRRCVSKPLYPVTLPGAPMYEVGAGLL